MGNDEVGCSSSDSSERPLKKAKYLWQVKGKQHLKSPPKDEVCRGRCLDRFLERTEAALDAIQVDGIEDIQPPDIPLSLVTPEGHNHDWYLLTWQARQIARGYIDNTINSVLERGGVAASMFDPDDFVEKCQQNGVVEDEGILMAIQAHGLQSQDEDGASSRRHPQDMTHNVQNASDGGEQSSDILSGILNLAVLAAIEKKGLSNK